MINNIFINPSKVLIKCILVIAFLGVAPQLRATPLDVSNPEVLEAYFDGVVKNNMEKGHSPSGVVTVMKDNQVIFTKGYGYSDFDKKIPVDPNTTLFRPGSISKLFTWVSVMQLVEQGKLDLDTDVNSYLKEVKVEDSWPGKPVTLRHILTHTAGFEDAAIGHLIIKEQSRIVPLAQALAAYQPKRINPPGEHVAYSNWATALAGLIVADVSGQNFNDYVQTHIFDVLGMTHTTFVEPLPEHLIDLRAKAYTFSQGTYVETGYELVSNFGPAGASATTALDMAKFARAILNGGSYQSERILKASTMSQMLNEGFVHDERVRGMGLGFIKYRYGADDLELFGHNGATTAFLSNFILSKSQNLMLFTSFSGNPLPGAVHKAVVKGFYDEFFPHTTEKSFIKGVDATKYAGSYTSWRSNFTQLESLLRLTSELKVIALADCETLLIMGKRYKAVDTNLFEEVNGYGRIAFQQSAEGEITSFVVDGFGVQQFFRTPMAASADTTVLIISLILIIFTAVILRICYQFSSFKNMVGIERKASLASIATAMMNILFFVFLFITLSSGVDDMVFKIPLGMKIALCFALLATAAVIVQLRYLLVVWQQKAFKNTLARVRYSLVTLSGLYMVWFFYYWNLLGFNYFE
ncbi:beta-lactamase family protein [Pseudoalteromonas shioyasakiensis]|uniref:serine hydrolase domain-containing protein n=1 Tax=Pseudoalteromonas shioyasakiensis TaxID=1190813 RepID=UPI0021172DF6|nr:serine hydrolase domain-containing protein [Pseudoalteromonas shioyasakiensis]MCQ8876978.1 beta-lactamase family protein [Pseudoalteromonas shioyasakiensis]